MYVKCMFVLMSSVHKIIYMCIDEMGNAFD